MLLTPLYLYTYQILILKFLSGNPNSQFIILPVIPLTVDFLCTEFPPCPLVVHTCIQRVQVPWGYISEVSRGWRGWIPSRAQFPDYLCLFVFLGITDSEIDYMWEFQTHSFCTIWFAEDCTSKLYILCGGFQLFMISFLLTSTIYSRPIFIYEPSCSEIQPQTRIPVLTT